MGRSAIGGRSPGSAQINELLLSLRWTHHLAAQAETLQVRLLVLPPALRLHVHMPVPRLRCCTSLHPKADAVLQPLWMRQGYLLGADAGHRRLGCFAHVHKSFAHAAGWGSRRVTYQRNTILPIQIPISRHAAARWGQAESPHWGCRSARMLQSDSPHRVRCGALPSLHDPAHHYLEGLSNSLRLWLHALAASLDAGPTPSAASTSMSS